MRVTSLADRADPSGSDEMHAACAVVPAHYPSNLIWPALSEIGVTDGPGRVRRLLDTLAPSPFAPWSETGGPRDAALGYAATFAAAEAALGAPSPWARTTYDYMDPWRGQLFGNIPWQGPTESFMAAIAPLAGHADELDALLDTGLGICDAIHSPLLAMYARILGACGLRTRNRTGDRARSARLVDEAVELDDRLGAGIARVAAENFPALSD